jgi:malate synthase
MDGAWTGHPDQNTIAVNQFPVPNQMYARPENAVRYPDLRPRPNGGGTHTLAGTRAAVRTVIRYRNGVLNGKGASLLDGYMEDLATDRIYRLMLAQRVKHHGAVKIADADGRDVAHTHESLGKLFDEELARILGELAAGKLKDAGTPETFREARLLSEQMILRGEFTPE